MEEARADRLWRCPAAHYGSHSGPWRERQSNAVQGIEFRGLSSVGVPVEKYAPSRQPSLRLWGAFNESAAKTEPPCEGRDSRHVTDFLLERYRKLGEAFLDGLTGSFAVVLVDPANDLVAIARDGMGSQYLAYSIIDGQLAGSRDDADLAGAPGPADRPPALRLSEFFSFEELSGSETFFDGVQALLPGEMVILQAGQLRRHWLTRPRLDARIERAHWEDYVEEFTALLDSSVRRCLEGVDRVAVMMSGGLDSTPIAALAARHLAQQGGRPAVTALSWRVSDPRGDESELIRKTADQLGIDVEWIDCDDAVPFSNLPAWPVHPATPEQTAFRWFHQRSYARAAELGHTVVLSGFCGDALYANARNWAWDLLDAEGPGRAIDRLREVAADIGWKRTLRSHLFGPLLPRTRELRRVLPSYLTPNAKQQLADRPRWPPGIETARRPRQTERLLALLDAHGANVERFYTKPFGLEQRTPLRDFDLVQFMLSVPDHLLQQGCETRPVLRAAVRGLVPEEIRLRQGKAAFHDVLDRGLATERLAWTRELLLDPDALWRGFIEESAVRSWIAETPAAGEDKIGYLHAIYGELWRRRRAGLPWPSENTG